MPPVAAVRPSHRVSLSIKVAARGSLASQSGTTSSFSASVKISAACITPVWAFAKTRKVRSEPSDTFGSVCGGVTATQCR